MRTFRKPAGGAERGLTLIELLVTGTLLAILLGLSVGGLARIGKVTALDGTERIVRGALQRIRSEAIESRSATFLELRPGGYGERARIVQGRTLNAITWHFEEADGPALGGRNRTARIEGARRTDAGSLGRGLAFGGEGGVIADRADEWLDPTRGFRLALDVRPDEGMQDGRLASYGDVWSLELNEDGSLDFFWRPLGESEQQSLSTGPHSVARGRWNRVAVSYDGLEVALFAHSVKQAVRKETRLLDVARQSSLVVGGRGLTGVIDEVSYDTIAWDEAVELDEGVEIVHQGPLLVRYDGEGRLDGRVHQGAVSIPLRLEREERVIRIEPSGVVR